MNTYLFNRCIQDDSIFHKSLDNCETVFLYERPCWESGMDSRSKKCFFDFPKTRKLELVYRFKESKVGGVLEEGFEYYLADAGSLTGGVNFDDTSKIKDFVEILHGVSKKLIIDITSMNIRLISALISNLVYNDDWDGIYICYSEPKAYKMERDDFDEQFLLNNKCFDASELPGLETTEDYFMNDYLWYVFLGFEGGRYSKLENDVSPQHGYEVPIISIPPMKAVWHNYAVKSNLKQINSYSQVEKIKYVSATNPFEVYNFLTKEKNRIGEKKLLISPLGTKPIALGVIMYLLEHMEDKSLTDCPVQTASNSDAPEITHYYDLTYYINSRRNMRFVDM